MCGRYSLTSTIDQLLPRLKGPLPDGLLKHYQPQQQHGRPEVGFAQLVEGHPRQKPPDQCPQ
jgi:hypothetical protein